MLEPNCSAQSEDEVVFEEDNDEEEEDDVEGQIWQLKVCFVRWNFHLATELKGCHSSAGMA